MATFPKPSQLAGGCGSCRRAHLTIQYAHVGSACPQRRSVADRVHRSARGRHGRHSRASGPAGAPGTNHADAGPPVMPCSSLDATSSAPGEPQPQPQHEAAAPDSSSSSSSSNNSSSSATTTTTTSTTTTSYRSAVSSSRRAVALSLGVAAAALPLLPALPSRAGENGSPPSSSLSSSSPPSRPSTADAGSVSRRFGAQATSPAGQLERDPGSEGGLEAAPPKPRRERRAVAPVPAVALAPGLRVSKVIRGTWQLSGRHTGDQYTDRTRGGEAVADMAAFARAGITSLDTADNYGPAEALIGQYLRLHPWDSPATTIATKLSYINEEQMAGVNRTLVEYAVRNCLVRTGRQRVDLVQLQWADPARYRKWLDVLKWLAELREQGMIGHIGLCNFDVPSLAKAMDARVGVVSNQVQYSLIDRRPALYMQQAAAAYGVKLIAYGTLAGGLIADKYYGVPAGKVRLDTASKQKYGTLLHQVGTPPGGLAGAAAAAGGGSWAFMQEVLEATRAVGERHGVSSSTVALAWVLQQPQVAAAVVGARNALHLRDLQAACGLRLDDADMLDLDAVWEGAPNPPTTDIYVWERGGAWAV